ncbi:class I SAM-dependent methyltransferase [Candidatus Microgenomates bacterium]|nr:class I SAM-dependent methyltransferase [Candidatus Microgenomates bacterium]
MINYDDWHNNSTLQKKIIGEKNFTYRHFLEKVIPNIKKSTELLDVGCGVGTIDFFLAKKVKKVVGIDVSENSIKIAQRNAKLLNLEKNLVYMVMNFPEDVPNMKFDLVVCSEVLEHLKDDSKAVVQIYSLLKRGGVSIISVPLNSAPLYKLGLMGGFDKKVGHLRRYSVEEVVDLLENNGFKIKKTFLVEGMFRNFLFTHRIGNFFVRVANRFSFVSDIYTAIDVWLGKLLGFSDVYIIAKK